MIIRNIYSKINIHPLFLFVAVSSLITGLFKDFCVSFIIIMIHEMGHILASLYYKFNIEKINIYPFGGYIKFADKLNRSINEELVILISGPLMQIIFYLIMSILHYNNIISSNTFNIIINYHYSLLIFNLLPIFPLDGSKLINLILSKYISFKRSHLYMIYISFITLLMLSAFSQYINFNVSMYLLLILLVIKTIEELQNHQNIFNKFLLERYLYNLQFKKVKVIVGSKLSKMMKDKKHLFLIGNKEISEKEMLKKRYTTIKRKE